jgi:hypothetical protein
MFETAVKWLLHSQLPWGSFSVLLQPVKPCSWALEAGSQRHLEARLVCLFGFTKEVDPLFEWPRFRAWVLEGPDRRLEGLVCISVAPTIFLYTPRQPGLVSTGEMVVLLTTMEYEPVLLRFDVLQCRRNSIFIDASFILPRNCSLLCSIPVAHETEKQVKGHILHKKSALLRSHSHLM